MLFVKITILGSGTILSGPERKSSSFLLTYDNDIALIDMGPGILYQLKILNIDLLRPDTIFLTHFHLDHCSDVFPFLMSRYLLESKSNNKLKIYGPPGLTVWYKTNASLQGKWLSECQPEIIELIEGEVEWAGYNVKFYPTRHTVQSIAYRFDGEKSVFFSGDTGFNKELIAFAENVDLGVLECSHPDEHPVVGHLTPKETGRFAQLANFEYLAVNHIYPENDTPNLKKQIATEFIRKIIILEDLMVLEDNI